MKTTKLGFSIFILTSILYAGTIISCIWGIVEFILYLVKDKPFNWLCIWSIIIGAILTFFSNVYMAVLESKQIQKDYELKQKERADIFGQNKTKKSKFQERLEQMQEQQRKERGL